MAEPDSDDHLRIADLGELTGVEAAVLSHLATGRGLDLAQIASAWRRPGQGTLVRLVDGTELVWHGFAVRYADEEQWWHQGRPLAASEVQRFTRE